LPADQTIVAGEMATVVRRYAHALYELAAEQKQLDAVTGDLRALEKLAQESAEFRAVAQNPRLRRAQLVNAVRKIAEFAGFHALSGNFLALVAQNRRLPQLRPMIRAFFAELAEKRGEFTAEVTSATALSASQKERLAAQLHALAGGKVHMTVAEDKSLLGGLVVKLGSRLIDASVKNKLARLERQLKAPSLTRLKGAA